MPFLLDTNIVSETIKPKPEERVLAWLEAQTPAELFLAAQTIGELVRGARKVKEKARRERFEKWIEQDLAEQFEGRVLPFDGAAAVLWGRLMGDGDRTGRTPAAADAQIAAVALQHDLTLVTRNVKDFRRFDVTLTNPWQGSGVA
ncbi:MAG: type II toxin-antitoxin system VapC family toxin [Alphaproteobacteria bacterium]|nr:type II toxin-antitoxin system VapC family toxin [Alphaproteobacteria bacterium]